MAYYSLWKEFLGHMISISMTTKDFEHFSDVIVPNSLIFSLKISKFQAEQATRCLIGVPNSK